MAACSPPWKPSCSTAAVLATCRDPTVVHPSVRLQTSAAFRWAFSLMIVKLWSFGHKEPGRIRQPRTITNMLQIFPWQYVSSMVHFTGAYTVLFRNVRHLPQAVRHVNHMALPTDYSTTRILIDRAAIYWNNNSTDSAMMLSSMCEFWCVTHHDI